MNERREVTFWIYSAGQQDDGVHRGFVQISDTAKDTHFRREFSYVGSDKASEIDYLETKAARDVAATYLNWVRAGMPKLN